MGALQDMSGGGRVAPLRAIHLIGRGDECHLVLSSTRASLQHASIAWLGDKWVLRDLASRNGTLCNGTRVARDVVLEVGDQLKFGSHDEGWVVTSVEPPCPIFYPPDGPARAIADQGMIALPSEESPQVTVYRADDDGWVLEAEGDTEPVPLENGAAFLVGGLPWHVYIPAPHQPTAEGTLSTSAVSMRPSLDAMRLELCVSPNEESAHARVVVSSQTFDLGDRVPFYLLAYLARVRISETRGRSTASKAAETEIGWVSTARACADVAVTPEQLALQVFRVRSAVQSCGIANPARVIERRRGVLRLGLPASSVVVR